MPVENEIKYLMRPEAFEGAVRLAAEQGGRVVDIEQHYLGPGVRIRRAATEGGEPVLTFTYKSAASIGLVEIETALSQRDFDALKENAVSSVVKSRVSLPLGRETWDVDRFMTPVGAFVLAEVELPEGVSRPASMPPFMYGNIVEELGRDPDYSNQAMSQGTLQAELALRTNAGMERSGSR